MLVTMKKLLLLLGLLLVLCVLGCEKKTGERPVVVGIINPADSLETVIEGFKQGMKARGYEEGRTIRYLYDGPLADVKTAGEVARRMMEQKVDLIYTMTTPATRLVKEAVLGTRTPVVFGPVFSPETSGLVDSLSRPGGNLTGVKVRGGVARGLDWFKNIFPHAKRIFVPFHHTDEAACLTMEDLEGAASKLEIEIVSEAFEDLEGLEAVLEKIPPDVDGVWMTCSFLLYSNVDLVVTAAAKRNLPVASAMHLDNQGVMLGYGEDDFTLGNQISRIADRILKGESPAVIPVETALYSLQLNLVEAEKLGVSISDSILYQADKIIR